jgi:hypothetical protein
MFTPILVSVWIANEAQMLAENVIQLSVRNGPSAARLPILALHRLVSYPSGCEALLAVDDPQLMNCYMIPSAGGASSFDGGPNLANEGNDAYDRPTTVDDNHIVIGSIVDLPCRTIGFSQETAIQWEACPYGRSRHVKPLLMSAINDIRIPSTWSTQQLQCPSPHGHSHAELLGT